MVNQRVQGYIISVVDVGVWDAIILKPGHDELEAASLSGVSGIIEADKGSISSKSSKPESVSWPSGAGVKEGSGSGSGSSKSFKPTAESSSWSGGVGGYCKSSKPQSDSWSSGLGVIMEGSGSGSDSGFGSSKCSSKRSKPPAASASWSGGIGGSGKSSKLEPESDSWSSDAGIIKVGSGSGSSKSSKLAADSSDWEADKLSGSGKGLGLSKSLKPVGGSADVLDREGSISDGSW